MSVPDDISGINKEIPLTGQITGILKELRENAEISAADAARDIGVSLEAYEKYEAGEQSIPIDILYRAANHFGIDFKVTLTGKNSRMNITLVCRVGEDIEVIQDPAPDMIEDQDNGLKQEDSQSYRKEPVDSETGILEWRRAYSTGISFLDEQHKEFINLTNELYAASRMGWKHSQAVFMRMIRYTVQYFQTDLKNEENIMERIDYPEYKEHKREHAFFLKEILRQTLEFKEGRKSNAKDFILFLRDWILSHVAICDKKLSLYLVKLKKGGNLNNIIAQVKIDEPGAPFSKTDDDGQVLKEPLVD
jgi:hemerythrin